MGYNQLFFFVQMSVVQICFDIVELGWCAVERYFNPPYNQLWMFGLSNRNVCVSVVCETVIHTSEHNDLLWKTVRYMVQPNRIKSYSCSVDGKQQILSAVCLRYRFITPLQHGKNGTRIISPLAIHMILRSVCHWSTTFHTHEVFPHFSLSFYLVVRWKAEKRNSTEMIR